MKTHKLVINEGLKKKTFYTVAVNTEMACEKVRQWLIDQERLTSEIETCVPKDSITIVEGTYLSVDEVFADTFREGKTD